MEEGPVLPWELILNIFKMACFELQPYDAVFNARARLTCTSLKVCMDKEQCPRPSNMPRIFTLSSFQHLIANHIWKRITRAITKPLEIHTIQRYGASTALFYTVAALNEYMPHLTILVRCNHERSIRCERKVYLEYRWGPNHTVTECDPIFFSLVNLHIAKNVMQCNAPVIILSDSCMHDAFTDALGLAAQDAKIPFVHVCRRWQTWHGLTKDLYTPLQLAQWNKDFEIITQVKPIECESPNKKIKL